MTFLLPAAIGGAIIAAIGYVALIFERRNAAKPTIVKSGPRDTTKHAIAR